MELTKSNHKNFHFLDRAMSGDEQRQLREVTLSNDANVANVLISLASQTAQHEAPCSSLLATHAAAHFNLSTCVDSHNHQDGATGEDDYFVISEDDDFPKSVNDSDSSLEQPLAATASTHTVKRLGDHNLKQPPGWNQRIELLPQDDVELLHGPTTVAALNGKPAMELCYMPDYQVIQSKASPNASAPWERGYFHAHESSRTPGDIGFNGTQPSATSSIPEARRQYSQHQQQHSVEGDHMMDSVPAVFFGWIRHPGTKAWREVVKVYSQNRVDYPSWSDDICVEVRTMLMRDKGISSFYYCRRTDTPHGSVKKIFDKKQSVTWARASDQEVLDRTKQRFVDDRKQFQPPVATKRPRGRPPKQSSSEESFELSEGLAQKQIIKVVQNLHQFLSKSNVSTQSLESLESWRNAESAAIDANDELSMDTSTSKLEALMVQLEFVASFVRKQLRDALEQTKYRAVSDEAESSVTADESTDCSTGMPPKKIKLTDATLQRRPWFPISSDHVCFQWNRHLGTIKWREAVEAFANDNKLYPEWDDAIADAVKQKLAQDGCSVFLVVLDSKGNDCASIQDGLWYLATDEEIVERTKQQFLDCRHQQI